MFEHGVALGPHNTLALRAQAADFLRINSADQLQALAAEGVLRGRDCLILGGGSNLVLPECIAPVVLKIEIKGRSLVGETPDHFLVQGGAGELWHDFVRWTVQQNRPGLENLSLIPGTLGAAPIQNIGAYGLEMAERFHSLTAIHLDSGESREFDAEACRFAYRDSYFKTPVGQRWVIVSVVFALPRAWQAQLAYAELAKALAAAGIDAPNALQVSDAVIAIRTAKLPDPAVLPNAGSFFKNPLVESVQHQALLALHPTLPAYAQADGRVKLAAGWLIEQAGWKGRSLGPVGMYERQALVLVNHGGAAAADVAALMAAVQADVLARFGVQLEAEPVFVAGATAQN